MKKTKKYKFRLPEQFDKYDINCQNKNWKKVDSQLRSMNRRMMLIASFQLFFLYIVKKSIFDEKKSIVVDRLKQI